MMKSKLVATTPMMLGASRRFPAKNTPTAPKVGEIIYAIKVENGRLPGGDSFSPK